MDFKTSKRSLAEIFQNKPKRKTKMKKPNFLHLSFGVVCFIALIAANKQERVPYTPYQMLAWEIKANEGYKSWWYPDGIVRGKQSYSIGFGWNDQGRRRKEIAKFTKDGKVTYDEATQITMKEIAKYGQLHNDPYKNLALQLYSYSRGLIKSGSALGKCCRGKSGCGSSVKNVRKAHNQRRQFELALWNHDTNFIIQRTEQNKSKIQKILMTL